MGTGASSHGTSSDEAIRTDDENPTLRGAQLELKAHLAACRQTAECCALVAPAGDIEGSEGYDDNVCRICNAHRLGVLLCRCASGGAIHLDCVGCEESGGQIPKLLTVYHVPLLTQQPHAEQQRSCSAAVQLLAAFKTCQRVMPDARDASHFNLPRGDLESTLKELATFKTDSKTAAYLLGHCHSWCYVQSGPPISCLDELR